MCETISHVVYTSFYTRAQPRHLPKLGPLMTNPAYDGLHVEIGLVGSGSDSDSGGGGGDDRGDGSGAAAGSGGSKSGGSRSDGGHVSAGLRREGLRWVIRLRVQL